MQLAHSTPGIVRYTRLSYFNRLCDTDLAVVSPSSERFNNQEIKDLYQHQRVTKPTLKNEKEIFRPLLLSPR